MNAAAHSDALDELRRLLCGVGVVGILDGHQVIRRDSVIGLLDRRRAEHAASRPPAITESEREELHRLRALINNPQTAEFLPAVQAEAAHQRQKWGEPHDRQKSAENWFWLVGYLSGKALRAAITGDAFKAKHHTISSAAALCNWFEAITKDESGTGLGADEDIKPVSEGGKEGDAPAADLDAEGHPKLPLSILESLAVDACNRVKAWAESDRTTPFPEQAHMLADGVLIMAAQRRKGVQ